MALFLANARRWTLGNEKARVFVSDYAPTVSIVLWTGISKIGRSQALGGDLQRLDVPNDFETTSGRPWFLNPLELEGWAIVVIGAEAASARAEAVRRSLR